MLYFAMVSIILGMVIRFLAIKENKSFNLAIGIPQALCKTGVYKYVRHPSYTGTFLIMLGLVLISLKVSLLYLTFMFFVSRAKQEEQLLSQFKEYQEYKQKTGMFLPRIRKWQQ